MQSAKAECANVGSYFLDESVVRILAVKRGVFVHEFVCTWCIFSSLYHSMFSVSTGRVAQRAKFKSLAFFAFKMSPYPSEVQIASITEKANISLPLSDFRFCIF